MAETNAEKARRGFEAAHRGELEAIEAMLDPDVKWHAGDPTAEGTCQNREQALQFMQRASQGGALPELVDVVDGGDKVVVILARRSEQGSTELVANLTTFRNGKATEMVHYPNPNDALAAAGL